MANITFEELKFTEDKYGSLESQSFDFDNSSVIVRISKNDKDFSQAKEIFTRCIENHENYKRDAYKLFDGEFWENDETDEEISENDYVKRVKLESIEIFLPEGTMTLWYDDDDLFFGHVIAIDIDGEGKACDASFHG